MSPAGPVSEEPGRPGRWVWVDLRLVPVAASIWTVQLTAPYLASLLLGGVAVASAGLAALAFRRATAALLLAVLAGLAVAGGFAVVRGLARADSPVTVAIADAPSRSPSSCTGVDGAAGPGCRARTRCSRG